MMGMINISGGSTRASPSITSSTRPSWRSHLMSKWSRYSYEILFLIMFLLCLANLIFGPL